MVIRHLLQRQLLLRYLRQQRVTMKVMIGFIVRGRVRIKIRIRVRVGVGVGVGVTLTLGFTTGAIVAGANVVYIQKYSPFKKSFALVQPFGILVQYMAHHNYMILHCGDCSEMLDGLFKN